MRFLGTCHDDEVDRRRGGVRDGWRLEARVSEEGERKKEEGESWAGGKKVRGRRAWSRRGAT